MNINIIGVPTFYGCDKNGPQFGPNKLREKGLLPILKKYNHTVFDLGNIYIDNISESKKFESNTCMKYFKQVLDISTNLAHSVNCSLSSNCFPLILGGDHSIALGSISGVSRYFNKKFAVIWFDAHGDINTYETSESKNIHGMPLASLMGYGHKEMKNLYTKGIKIYEDNVFHIGARDIDPGEHEFIKNSNMNVYYPSDIYSEGIDSIINSIINNILNKDIDALHISFDLDFIDSKYVPGTGTRVENGFTVEDTKYMLSKLANSGLVKSMDFVEFNPLLDIDDVTADIAIDILDSVFKYIQ